MGKPCYPLLDFPPDVLDDIKEEASKKSAFCSSKTTLNTDSATVIKYDKVFLESNNILGASMSAGSGVFVAGAGGSYLVSAGMEMMMDAGQTHNIWVRTNGENIQDSRMTGSCDVLKFFGLYDNGSKDIVVHLEAGDEVTLYTDASPGLDLQNIVFCVQSLKVTV